MPDRLPDLPHSLPYTRRIQRLDWNLPRRIWDDLLSLNHLLPQKLMRNPAVDPQLLGGLRRRYRRNRVPATHGKESRLFTPKQAKKWRENYLPLDGVIV